MGINFNGVTKQLTVSVFSADGKLADEFTINSRQNHYSTDHLKKGVYFLKMYDMKGNHVAVQKLIKN
jgi:hypothetical protein